MEGGPVWRRLGSRFAIELSCRLGADPTLSSCRAPFEMFEHTAATGGQLVSHFEALGQTELFQSTYPRLESIGWQSKFVSKIRSTATGPAMDESQNIDGPFQPTESLIERDEFFRGRLLLGQRGTRIFTGQTPKYGSLSSA